MRVMVGASENEVRRLLARLDEVDPVIRSVSAISPDAVAAAQLLDAEADAGRRRSALHGQVVVVKDNIDTAGLSTTAGSLALADVSPAADAPLVTRLREAGLVILGKTNLSEWANIRDEHSVSGWSGHGGLTRNPYALNRTAWGSSSGSGAAVAARLAAYAIGTETDGSITAPAAACGVVGLKPTVGSVPGEGIVPISWTQDSAGPMALTVAGVAALLDVLAGSDSASSLAAPVAGLRVGIPRGLWGYSLTADAAAERAVAWLSAAGVEVVDVALPALQDFDGLPELTVMLVELRAGLARYLAGRGSAVRSLEDVVAFNRAHADAELAVFGQSLFEQALELDGPDSPAYAEALAACAVPGVEELDRVLREARVDALLAPATGPATPIDVVNGDHYLGGCSTQSALAGAPILTVPVELAGGLPVAVSLWGDRGSDALLLRLGAAVEAGRDAASGPLPEPAYAEWV
jgi:amidase